MGAPAVGQYKTENMLTQRNTGGCSKSTTARGCYFYDEAVKRSQSTPAPTCYNPKPKESGKRVASFKTPQSYSRQPTKPSEVGAGGYYNPKHDYGRKRVPCFVNSKGASYSFLQDVFRIKDKEKLPAPGHRGIPESTRLDQAGQRNHASRMLHDRYVSPRNINK